MIPHRYTSCRPLALCALLFPVCLSCEPRNAAEKRRLRAAREIQQAVLPPTPKSDSQLAAEGKLKAELERRAAVAAKLLKSLGRTRSQVESLPPLVLPEPTVLAATTAKESEQRALMLKSARTAWRYMARNVGASGFVSATEEYLYATVWDMASTLAATYSARELGIITPEKYRSAMDAALETLLHLPLYDSVAFNKLYSVESGRMVNRMVEPTREGYGWSALDHGRMLTWLRIVGTDSTYTARTRAIVGRLKLDRLIVDGYLRGQDLNPRYGQPLIAKRRVYGEGRIGYEQYAAEGYALWGAPALLASNFAANARPVQVLGNTVLADVRGTDVLTSEPFIMMGLELGWTSPYWRPLALAVLAAQEARSRETGRITLVSEDAVNDPPWFFYYYLLYRDGNTFVVASPLGHVSPHFPRWVSTKSAFGYHALAPSDFTWRALRLVQPSGARGGGWTAGVYEGQGTPTNAYNLNTAAVVLEAAAYMMRGRCPLIEPTCARH